jgi:alanine racemase
LSLSQPNWIEVDEGALARNFGVLQAQAGPGTEVLAVIKANGYGHGAEWCARVLVEAGAQWLGVTCAAEGARVRQALREARLECEILIMSGFLPGDVAAICDAGLTPVLWTAEQVDWLDGLRCAVHVEVDTGMGRQGVRPGEELGELLQTMQTAGLELDGLFTHFCSSEEAGSALTVEQEERFEEAVAQGYAAGLAPRLIHAGNSSAVDNPLRPDDEAGRDPWLERLAAMVGARAMVRTGLALYGYCLPIEGAAAGARVRGSLEPVMTWKARVLAVRELEPGETVGYNATFTATERMRVALLPVGYADGLRRELSGSGWVMIARRRAAILGRVSMNLTVVDVTAIAGVRAGDEAVVLGAGITADDHARLAGTIAYEIVCGVHPCG